MVTRIDLTGKRLLQENPADAWTVREALGEFKQPYFAFERTDSTPPVLEAALGQRFGFLPVDIRFPDSDCGKARAIPSWHLKSREGEGLCGHVH